MSSVFGRVFCRDQLYARQDSLDARALLHPVPAVPRYAAPSQAYPILAHVFRALLLLPYCCCGGRGVVSLRDVYVELGLATLRNGVQGNHAHVFRVEATECTPQDHCVESVRSPAL